jgi:hypothetical protein
MINTTQVPNHSPSRFFSGGAQHFLRNTGVRPDRKVATAAREGMAAMINAGKRISVATWNIAAINNNPFEYWITYKENPNYEDIMAKVEQFLESPGSKDVPVSDVFTEDMFSKLDERLKGVGWVSVKQYWEEDFRNRKIVSGFMKVRAQYCIVLLLDLLFNGFSFCKIMFSLSHAQTKQHVPSFYYKLRRTKCWDRND